MKSEAGFEKLYQSELALTLNALEETRKKVVKEFWKATSWLLGLIPVLIITAIIKTPWALLIGIIPVVIYFLRLGDYRQVRDAYVLEFKRKVIGRIITLMNPELKYVPQALISTSEYREADIFRNRIDSYAGDDLVEGFIEKTWCRFSEVYHQEKQESVDSRGRHTTTWVTIFKGIFFIADFNKNFNGRTYVLPDASGSFFGLGKLFEGWMSGRGERVKLESPQFEKLFSVFSDDQVEARYILSTSMMQRLISFHSKVNTPLRISFIHSKVFIAIPVNRDLFEPNIFSSGVKKEYIAEYFHYLNLVTGIVEELNLNVRIWSKQ